MANENKSSSVSSRSKKEDKEQLFKWSLSKMNYIILGIGLLVITLGYVFMAQGPHDSFMSLSVSPILLLLGYVVIIPLALIYGVKVGPLKIGTGKSANNSDMNK